MREIVIVMGFNAAGKSTAVQQLVDQGYHRINRDERGGTLDGQAEYASVLLQSGHDKLVLDNTYPTIKSRESIIAAGKKHGVPVRCIWLTTSFEDAQLNACLRMVEKHQRLLAPEDFKKIDDPNSFPPAALFTYKKNFEKPTIKEGFSTVEQMPFVRRWAPQYTNKALLLDFDDTLRRSIGPNNWPTDPAHVEILPGRAEKLKEYASRGYKLLGVSNQSAIAKGLDIEIARACFRRTCELLGMEIEFQFCPHKIPPVTCYCRKPHPGIGAYFIWKHKLNPTECIMVGDQTTDKTFAERCGFQFQYPHEFFG